jgi:hypothetical protein
MNAGAASVLVLAMTAATWGSSGQRLADHDEVVTESVQNSEGVNGLHAAFAVRASREEIWQLLIAYAQFKTLYPNIEDLEVSDESDRGARVRYVIRVAWMRYGYLLQRDYAKRGHLLTWHLISGDLRVVSGHWRISEGVSSGYACH